MDFLNKSIQQIGDLFKAMSPAARMTAGLLLAVVVISRDVLIALFYFSFVALGSGFRQIPPSMLGKGCTAFQMATLVAVLAAPGLETMMGQYACGLLLNGLFLMTVFMTLASGIDYLYAARLSLVSPDRMALIESDRPEDD